MIHSFIHICGHKRLHFIPQRKQQLVNFNISLSIFKLLKIPTSKILNEAKQVQVVWAFCKRCSSYVRKNATFSQWARKGKNIAK